MMAINLKDYSKTIHTGIKLHKDDKTFFFDMKVGGKRYRKVWESNPSHNKADKLKTAYNECEKFRTETLYKNTIVADPDATVLDYWKKLKDLKKGEKDKEWKPYLIKEYDHYYDKNLTKLSDIKIKDVKAGHFTALNATLKHLSIRSRLKAYEILKPLFELALEDEIIRISPIKKSHVPKRKSAEEKKVVTHAVSKYKVVHQAIHRIYGTRELIKINDTISVQCRENPMYRALFLFGFYGRRVGETVKLRWENVDFENKTYTIRGTTSKVNQDMTFKLPADIVEALLEFRDVEGNIFNVKSVDRQYWKIREVTGIQEFTFHWMRNLAVSALSSMGVSNTHLSGMLGHTDLGTIRKYLNLQNEEATAVTNEASQRLLS